MTLTQLRALVAAADQGSFTAAGRLMGYSQAAVSELVRRLEDECGLQLFRRTPRRLALTAAGEHMLPHARQAVTAADNAAAAVKSLRELTGGIASFGLFRNADLYLLAELGARFTAAHPEVRTRLVGVNSALVARDVARGDLEAGMVVLPVHAAGLEIIPVARDEVLYVSSDPDRARLPVDIVTFAQRRLVLYDADVGWSDPDRMQLAERARLAGVRIEPFMEVEHAQAALHLVANGVGDTFVSRTVAEHTVKADHLQVNTVAFDPPLYNIFALIRRLDVPLSPATQELTRLALELLLSMPDLDHDIPGNHVDGPTAWFRDTKRLRPRREAGAAPLKRLSN